MLYVYVHMKNTGYQLATFAMGCFWQPDYIFSKVKGVASTRVGYTGGDPSLREPTYEEVSSGTTGYAEAIEITFDPKVITYAQLLDLFWQNHDPTTINRQGPDVGAQYRSAIFYHSEEQRAQALASKAKWLPRLIDPSRKIVTEIKQASTFYVAEEYHQKYLETNNRTCHISQRVFR